ncbi:hypothetical protein P171DRAFT_479577 [Karstenula rhodostoma CBS 690.94]|uniref:Uncharacterized protein n=1 Tax=Karstenula rhodostoma CBS 690.94 TaxID=1392251 RepID=A0A9P4PUK7_9PLEO|nr:hypothetical protein P171DRAFT_479577 [Karstenula rhodostoma CBS 690.94]
MRRHVFVTTCKSARPQRATGRRDEEKLTTAVGRVGSGVELELGVELDVESGVELGVEKAASGAPQLLCSSAGVGTCQAAPPPRSSSPDLLSRLRRYPCPRTVLLAAHRNTLDLAVPIPPCPVIPLPLPLPRYLSNFDEPQSVHTSWLLPSAVVQEPPATMRAPATYTSPVPGRRI